MCTSFSGKFLHQFCCYSVLCIGTVQYSTGAELGVCVVYWYSTVQYRSRVRCVCCVLVQYSTGAELGVCVLCIGTVQYRSRVRCVCCVLVQYSTVQEQS